MASYKILAFSRMKSTAKGKKLDVLKKKISIGYKILPTSNHYYKKTD